MTANAGYHAFSTGDVLTAAQVQYNLQNQTIMYFASSAARTAALSGVLVEGMFSYLADTDSTEYYNGSAWTSISNPGDITSVTAGTGITGGGTSGAVTITNDMATTITTAGDLIKGTGSGTYARLGIGSTGQVLTVSGGAPSWATPAASASGLTLISRSTFSAVATKQVTGCFTSTYENYLVLFKLNTNTADASLKLRFSVSGTDDSGANYYYAAAGIRPTGATSTPLQSNAATSADVGRANNNSTQSQNLQMTIFSPQLAKYTGFTGASYMEDSTAGIGLAGGGAFYANTQFDGITFFPTSGNMTGTIAVYGYALT